jgi:hypothetical protein
MAQCFVIVRSRQPFSQTGYRSRRASARAVHEAFRRLPTDFDMSLPAPLSRSPLEEGTATWCGLRLRPARARSVMIALRSRAKANLDGYPADTLTTKDSSLVVEVHLTYGGVHAQRRRRTTLDCRSALVAVADLDRSIAFYQELVPFDVIVREDDVAVLGGESPESFGLILRQTPSIYPTRHGQQSLGLRFITLNVGSLSELDQIESQLRRSDLFTQRREIGEGASEVILGRDPDNLPLAFVYDAENTLGPDYYRTIGNLVYALDA